MNIPTLVTIFRLISVPFFFVTFALPYHGSHIFAVSLFTAAALSDWLDGYLARYLSQSSSFGAFLDPVADKLLVATALILLLAKSHLFHLALPISIIIGREITVSALREWIAGAGCGQLLAVSYLGKIKTVMQCVALLLLLAFVRHPTSWVFWVGDILLHIAAIFTLISMCYYFKEALPQLGLAKKKA